MVKSRRRFLRSASAGLAALSTACRKAEQKTGEATPGAPPTFGAAPEVGPPVSASTFAEAEKLIQFPMSPAERDAAAGSWRKSMAPLYERRTGPRKVGLDPSVAPALRWDPALPGVKVGPEHDHFERAKNDPGPLPANDQDIAFASVGQLSRWIESRKLTSERLTNIYLSRLERFDPK